MKKPTIARFAKTAIKVSDATRRPIRYGRSQDRHIVVCDYFFIAADDDSLSNLIISQIPSTKCIPDDLCCMWNILVQLDKATQVIDSGVLYEDYSGTRRFFFNDDHTVAVAVNDAYYRIFAGEKGARKFSSGANGVLFIKDVGYIAGILPFHARSCEGALSRMAELIESSGYQHR